MPLRVPFGRDIPELESCGRSLWRGGAWGQGPALEEDGHTVPRWRVHSGPQGA